MWFEIRPIMKVQENIKIVISKSKRKSKRKIICLYWIFLSTIGIVQIKILLKFKYLVFIFMMLKSMDVCYNFIEFDKSEFKFIIKYWY